MDKEYNLSNPSVAEEERMIKDKIDEEYDRFAQNENEMWKQIENEYLKQFDPSNMKDLDPDIQKIVDDNFWDLI